MVQRVTNYDKSLNLDLMKHPLDREGGKQLTRHIARFDASQPTAVDATFNKVMRDAGRLVRFRVMVGGALAAAAESMVFDLLVNGVSALSAAVTVDSGDAVDTFYEGTLTGGQAIVARGDLITLDFNYTAGGGPTPATNHYAEVDIEYDA